MHVKVVAKVTFKGDNYCSQDYIYLSSVSSDDIKPDKLSPLLQSREIIIVNFLKDYVYLSSLSNDDIKPDMIKLLPW